MERLTDDDTSTRVGTPTEDDEEGYTRIRLPSLGDDPWMPAPHSSSCSAVYASFQVSSPADSPQYLDPSPLRLPQLPSLSSTSDSSTWWANLSPAVGLIAGDEAAWGVRRDAPVRPYALYRARRRRRRRRLGELLMETLRRRSDLPAVADAEDSSLLLQSGATSLNNVLNSNRGGASPTATDPSTDLEAADEVGDLIASVLGSNSGSGDLRQCRRSSSFWSWLLVTSVYSVTLLYLALKFSPDLSDENFSPIEIWSIVWLLISMLTSTLTLAWVNTAHQPPQIRLCIQAIQTTLFILNLGWFVYGAKLLWTPDDDDVHSADPKTPDSRHPPSFSVVVAAFIWWYQAACYVLSSAFYGIVCLCLPCLLYAVRSDRASAVQESLAVAAAHLSTANLVRSLKVTTYARQVEELTTSSSSSLLADASPHLQQTASADNSSLPQQSCVICMQEFLSEDQVMVLPCDDRHFFHRECVEAWLRKRLVCPMCRKALTASPAAEPSRPIFHEMAE